MLAGSSGHAISVWAVGSLTIAVGAAIFVGFLTLAASAAATVGYLMAAVSSFLMSESNNHIISTSAAFNLAAISAALVLLGPGAFSFDARFFGRREIVIPDSRGSPRR